GGAPFEIGIQTMLVISVRGRERAAAPKIELASDPREGVAQRGGMGEWAEITRPVIGAEARQREPRDGIVQVDLEQQEPFVVPKTDVVARMEFLDELAFEQQRFGLAFHCVDVEVVDGINQRAKLEI